MHPTLQSWLILAAAIASEVTATSALKLVDGFSRLLPLAAVVIGYGLSFWLLSRVVQRLELGLVYAVWCGVGMSVVAVIGVLAYGESMTLLKLGGMAFITVGVIMLSFATHPAV
jgi:small multidrug resistance pump